MLIDAAGARALDCARQALEVLCPVVFRRARPLAREVFRLSGLAEG